MIKFEHSIFALPFAYMGLFWGEGGMPSARLFLWVTLAMVGFRTMAMALNRIIDAAIDAANPRTAKRAIPAGRLKPAFAWAAVAVSFSVFEASAWALGRLCFSLSPIPVFLAVLYPYAKKITWLSHALLGMILGIAPYAAWLASRGVFAWEPGFLTAGVASWVAGFDILYALQDQDFDRNAGLYSVPAVFGTQAALQSAKALHLAAVLFWAGAGLAGKLGVFYFAGLGFSALLLAREHWLVHTFGLGKINEAFFTMNAMISILVFSGLAADLLS